MNYRIILESFKFYKLRSDKAVKILLLITILIRACVTMAPIGDRNFEFITNLLNGQFLTTGNITLPSQGNLIIIALYSIGTFLIICIGLIYAEVFILENEEKRTDKIKLDSKDIFVIPLKKTEDSKFANPEELKSYVKKTFAPSSFKRFIKKDPDQKFPYLRTAIKDLLRFLPGLILLIIMLGIVFVISSTLLMIPFLILLFILLFTPLNYMYTQNKLTRSMELSYAQTNGAKLSMFFTFVVQNFIINLVSNIFALMLADYYYSYLVIESFLYAIRVFAMSRLYSLFYQMLALRQPYSS